MVQCTSPPAPLLKERGVEMICLMYQLSSAMFWLADLGNTEQGLTIINFISI
jgi:hypothetical protein